ncbi:MAG: hypothetical protein VX000_08850, partial [Myxococcota bacterium]|nr:hypothetical protein [Myxococcota bacterium]
MKPLPLLVALAFAPSAPAQQAGWERAGSTYGSSYGATDYAANPATGVLGQLGEIDRELTAVRIEALELEEKSVTLDMSRGEHADDLAIADAQLGRQREEVKAWLSTLYRLHRRGLARVVFGAEDPTDLRRRATYLMSIVDASSARMQSFLAAIDTHRKLLAQVEGDMAELAALRTELEIKEAELEERRGRRVELLGQIRSQRKLGMQAMDEYSQARQDLSGSWGGGWNGAGSTGSVAAAPSRAVVATAPSTGT